MKHTMFAVVAILITTTAAAAEETLDILPVEIAEFDAVAAATALCKSISPPQDVDACVHIILPSK